MITTCKECNRNIYVNHPKLHIALGIKPLLTSLVCEECREKETEIEPQYSDMRSMPERS